MNKRETIIYSIERCISHVPDACRDCAYDAGQPYNECVDMLLRNVLELLKEQEQQIEHLEHDLAVTQNSLNYYINGND